MTREEQHILIYRSLRGTERVKDGRQAMLSRGIERAHAMDTALDYDGMFAVYDRDGLAYGPTSRERCHDHAARHGGKVRRYKTRGHVSDLGVEPVDEETRVAIALHNAGITKAQDALPGSDLEFYQRCAAACMRLC